jgi:hypothetical protein
MFLSMALMKFIKSAVIGKKVLNCISCNGEGKGIHKITRTVKQSTLNTFLTLAMDVVPVCIVEQFSFVV